MKLCTSMFNNLWEKLW